MDDAREIENLIYRYAQFIDSGDLESVATLFSNGRIVSSAHNTEIVGFEEVLDLYRGSCRIYEDTGTPCTKHLTTNVLIEFQTTEFATANSYYTVIQATTGLALQPIISGRYQDEFTKRNDKWEFSQREMFVDLIGDCSHHLLYDASAL